MAIVLVQSKQPEVSTAVSTITLSAEAKAGNLLVAFVSKTAGTEEPTVHDNISGTGAWTANATKALNTTSANSLWVFTKTAVGGEKEIIAEKNTAGVVQGVVVFELSGASTTVDTIVHTDNSAAEKTCASPEVTTTDAGSVILAAVSDGAGAFGVVKAWTNSITNVNTITNRTFGGSRIPGVTLSKVVFTAEWTTSRAGGTGMLLVAFKPTSGEKTQKMEASLSFAGLLSRNIFHAFTTPKLTFIGKEPRNIFDQFNASVTPSVAISTKTQKGLSGKLEFLGRLTTNVAHALSGSISFVGTLTKRFEFTRQFVASVSFVGAIPRNISRSALASLSFVGKLGSNVVHQLRATLEPVAVLGRSTQRKLASSISFLGAIPRNVTRSTSASLTFAGSIGKNVSHALQAVLTPIGRLFSGGAFVQHLPATLSFVGSLPRSIFYRLTGTVSFVGTLPRKTVHGLTSSLSFVGSLSGKAIHAMASTLSFAGSVSARVVHGFTSTLSFVGTLPRNVVRELTASLTTAGTLKRSVVHQLQAALSFFGSLHLPITPVVVFNATMSFVGSIRNRSVRKPFASVLSFLGTLFKIPKRPNALFILYTFGVDQLVVTEPQRADSHIVFLPKPAVVADRLVHTLGYPQLIEYAPNTVENKLSVPDDLTLEPWAGLEIQDQTITSQLPRADADLAEAGNKTRLRIITR